MAKTSKKPKNKKSKKVNGSKVNRLEGMEDISPKNTKLWRAVWNAGNKIARLHNFHYVETPVVERAELFENIFSNDADLSSDKLFTFKSGTRTRMALRPEGGASVMRSYLENQLGYFSLPLRAYYTGPMFRKGRKGEKRQFREWGFQIIGDSDPVYGAQVIFAILNFLEDLGLSNPVLKINAVGCRVCRPSFQRKVKNYYQNYKNLLCRDCRERYERDPVTVFRCNRKKCLEIREGAPNILDHLCQNCNNHFQNILKLIEDNGVEYVSDPYLVGDKNYYSKFVFEVYPNRRLDTLVASGGRQDYLAERIGGRQLPSSGGNIYLDNLVDYLQKSGKEPHNEDEKERLFFIAVGNEARNSSLKLMDEFRKKGIVVIESLGKRTMESQLKAAQKSGAGLALIYGQKEVFEGTAVIRELDSGIQESIPLEDVVNVIKTRMKKVLKRNRS